MIVIIMITSLWAHTTQAEAPLADSTDTVSETLVDGLTVKERAQKIDAYFVENNMPLAGHGLAMVTAADKYGIDWRLIAAIGVIESTGGKFACKKVKYSAFGWGSCKINFSSYEESIDVITRNLAGENPKTAHHYDGKDTIGILSSYNQERSDYKKIVLGTMDKISKMDATAILAMK